MHTELSSGTYAAVNANLTGSTFTDVCLAAARFSDVNLAGATFQDINLAGARFDDVNLSGAAIARANIEGMTLDGIPVTDLLAAYRAARPPSR